MLDVYNFFKKNNPNFAKDEERLEEIEMNFETSEPISIVEEEQKGYNDDRWIEKSKLIKERDNYTCQLCHAFDARQGHFIFMKQGEYETCHHYYWAGSSKYDIYVKGYLLSIYIDFYPGYHLAMPRLNVHHKIYYRNRNLWDYEDDCLVTLCEDCHHFIHSLNNIGIPIVDKDSKGQNVLIGRTKPNPYHPQLDHTDLGTFKPLALVKENLWGDGLKGQDLVDFKKAKIQNKEWYDYHEIFDNDVAQISYFTSYDKSINNHSPEEMKKIAEFIILDFIENILGFRKQSSNL